MSEARIDGADKEVFNHILGSSKGLTPHPGPRRMFVLQSD